MDKSVNVVIRKPNVNNPDIYNKIRKNASIMNKVYVAKINEDEDYFTVTDIPFESYRGDNVWRGIYGNLSSIKGDSFFILESLQPFNKQLELDFEENL